MNLDKIKIDASELLTESELIMVKGGDIPPICECQSFCKQCVYGGK